MATRANTDSSRTAILDAALEAFAREGAAGARTEEIARAAGVNKALLYYYFKDKDALLGAALEHAMEKSVPRLIEVIESKKSPKKQLEAYLSAYFDNFADRPRLARLMQYEMLRASEGSDTHLRLIVSRFMKPLSKRVRQMIRNGIDSGDFREVDPQQTALSIASTVVFYFISAPALRELTGEDPFEAAALSRRKAAVIDFIFHALDPSTGRQKRVSRR